MKKITVTPAKSKNTTKEEFLRVAVYIRVSTDSKEQELSFELQYSYFNNQISETNNWILVKTYKDFGKSGLSISKRDGFKEMISDAKKRRFDLLIVKSLSRFARNTVDSVKTIRLLLEHNIEIIFDVEKMYIKKDDSELLLSILSAFAQEESASKSKDIRWGINRKMKEGTYIMKAIYGYRSVDQQLFINQSEADVVRLIYELYLNNNSYGTIKAELEKRDLLSPTGGNTWSTKTIERILSNEKYLGRVTYPKSFSKDYLNNQRLISKGEITQYTVYDNHDSIISEDEFNQVQGLKQRRSNYETNSRGKKVRKKTRISKDEIVNTIRCEYCGCSYRRRKERGKVVYRCSNRMENGRQACPNSKTMRITE